MNRHETISGGGGDSGGPLRLPALPAKRAPASCRAACALLCCFFPASCHRSSWSGPAGGGDREASSPSTPVLEVRINEVMTSNTRTLPDESGAFPPWLEVYNAGDTPVDLSGVPLSDDRLAPEKWSFPAGPASIVTPGSHLVVFCDGGASRESELHASFTLVAGPLDLVLNKGSDLFFAEASAIGPDRTLGRFPDGAEGITELDAPTPGAANAPPAERSGGIRGDVDGDGAVNVIDVIRLLGFLFRGDFTPHCLPVADANVDGAVDRTDAVRIIDYLFLRGQPLTALNPEELAECGGNAAPQVAPRPVYHAYPGHSIELRIEATDPDGDRLLYEALDLPRGASLAENALVRWTPEGDQLGPFYMTFVVTDEATPPHRVMGRLVFQVHPLHPCVRPDCDPELGCEPRLAPLGEECCGGPGHRLTDPLVGCPEGIGLHVGRNPDGSATIGRLVNCDLLPMVPLGQGGHIVRLNLEARCLEPSRVLLEVHLETAGTILLDELVERDFTPRSDGFFQLRNLRFIAEGPFGENMQAQLTVAATAADGVRLERRLRVRLTRGEVPGLP